MRALVCLPTYLEVENIEDALRRVRKYAPSVDMLVIDDNSPDGTADLAERLAQEIGQIDVLRRPEKKGLGEAYRAGFAVGIERGYDVLVQMDADLSHDAASLPALLQAIDEGADLVIGSRYVPGGSIPHWPWHRRALSKWGNWYATTVLGMPLADATSGYRVYRASTLKAIDYETSRAKGYGFQIEVAYRWWCWGGHIEQVPITFTARVRGVSKMTLKVALEELGLVSYWGFRDRVLHRGS